MARIITLINNLQLIRIPQERDERSIGELALDTRVVDRYVEAGYAQQPKSKEEAKERGVKGWNGLNTSLVNYHIYSLPGQNIVVATLAPTRYLFRQAMEDLVQQGGLTEEDILKMSPNLTGSSLLVVGKQNQSPVLISQVKGNALGSGEVHAALAAGGMPGHYVTNTQTYPDPITAGLTKEAVEEIGTSFDSHKIAPHFLVGEEETGQSNFANLLFGVLDLTDVLHTYENSVKKYLSIDNNKNKLEVAGISILPLDRPLFTIKNGERILADVVSYTPSEKGTLERTIQDRRMRPYTQAVLDYLTQEPHLESMLRTIGF